MKLEALRDLFASLSAAVAGHPLLERLAIASLEAALLAALCAGALALLRPRSARLRALAWLIVFAKPIASLAIGGSLGLVTVEVAAATARANPPGPIAVPIAEETSRIAPIVAAARDVAAPTPSATVAAAEPVAATAPPPASSPRRFTWPWSASTTLAGAWLAGIALMVGRSLLSRLRVRSLLAAARPAEARLAALARSVAAQIASRPRTIAAPRVLRSDDLDSPALVGLFRPTVVVPAWMTDERDLGWSLRHELMHCALRDPLAALLRELAETLLFFHPAVWWAGRRWEEAAELACDRAIVADEAESLDYADRLCEIARSVRGRAAPSLWPAFFVARSRVGRRLEALLESPLRSTATLGRCGAIALALFTFSMLAFGARLQSAAPAAAAKPADDGDVVHVHGRVFDPDGKPVADAPVVIRRWYWDELIPHPDLTTTSTDHDGRFAATYRKSQFLVDSSGPEQWRNIMAACSVDGFGVGWDDTYTSQRGRDDELTLHLVKDLPIAGRVVDLEGRPVAGASVQVKQLGANAKEDLGPFLASLRARGEGWHSNSPDFASRYFQPRGDQEWSTVTDAEGRFELRGLGAHRVAHLEVRGETIALLRTVVVTEPLERPIPGDRRFGSDLQQFHGAAPVLVAQPTQPIEGVVRASDGGAPLPDVEVTSYVFAGLKWGGEKFLSTTTDEAGRFRLVGMPKGRGNQLYLRPNDEQPYFERVFEVPDRPGLETIETEIELERGIWITGHVTDAKSGGPGRGTAHWVPLFRNTFMQKRPQLAPGGLSMQGDQNRFRVAADGSFRVVGLPGPAAIGVETYSGYRQGVGFELFASEKSGTYGISYDNPVGLGAKWPTTMAPIDPPADATSATCDLRLERGESIRMSCVDEQSQPLADFEVCGDQPFGNWHAIAGPVLEICHLGPGEQRPVGVRQTGRKLGRYATLSLAGGAEQRLTLLPLVTVTGRLLDSSGDLVRRCSIFLEPAPSHDFETASGLLASDDAGRFRFELIPCGTDWGLSTWGPGGTGDFPLLIPIGKVHDPKPGAVVDLGDVVCTAAN
jgi:beta-lactamase regulating signal transducer with metallopeptidase domain